MDVTIRDVDDIHPKWRKRPVQWACERVDRKPAQFHIGSVKSVTSQFGTLACCSFFFSASSLSPSSHAQALRLDPDSLLHLHRIASPWATSSKATRGSTASSPPTSHGSAPPSRLSMAVSCRFLLHALRFTSTLLSTLLLQLVRLRALNCVSLSVSWFWITSLRSWAWGSYFPHSPQLFTLPFCYDAFRCFFSLVGFAIAILMAFFRLFYGSGEVDKAVELEDRFFPHLPLTLHPSISIACAAFPAS